MFPFPLVMVTKAMPAAVPTERELQALKVIWHLRQATVREICDAIHQRGTELAVEHIERYWCPSTTSVAIAEGLR